ncbi:hypothetical protein ACFUEM_08755 [Streptomyces anulatus]|uniref:hypothetical protein n=1 Tax=Streptomyces anulatus TaxID=1892 RepID=UPI0035E25C3F
MSDRTVTPGGPWVNAGAFEVRTLMADPVGTIRVRPVSSDVPRRFQDRDGDVWIEVGVSSLQHVGSTAGDPVEGGRIDDRSWIEHQFGPLTEIRPDIDVRALLADAFDGLAEELRKSTDLPRVLEAVAKRMREESA